MKVIFLDIDGVLNSREYFASNFGLSDDKNRTSIYNKDSTDLLIERQMMNIDTKKLSLLKRITDETQAKVVITSSKWKNLFFFPQIVAKLNEFGIPVIGATEDSVLDRGTGIKRYLALNDISDYVVLDGTVFDDYDEIILSRLIKTDYDNGGLQEKDASDLIKRLKK